MIIHWSEKHATGPPGESKPGTDCPESELLTYSPNPAYSAIRCGGKIMFLWKPLSPYYVTSPPYTSAWHLSMAYAPKPTGTILTLTQD